MKENKIIKILLRILLCFTISFVILLTMFLTGWGKYGSHQAYKLSEILFVSERVFHPVATPLTDPSS